MGGDGGRRRRRTGIGERLALNEQGGVKQGDEIEGIKPEQVERINGTSEGSEGGGAESEGHGNFRWVEE
jgi:hypothetical protein